MSADQFIGQGLNELKSEPVRTEHTKTHNKKYSSEKGSSFMFTVQTWVVSSSSSHFHGISLLLYEIWNINITANSYFLCVHIVEVRLPLCVIWASLVIVFFWYQHMYHMYVGAFKSLSVLPVSISTCCSENVLIMHSNSTLQFAPDDSANTYVGYAVTESRFIFDQTCLAFDGLIFVFMSSVSSEPSLFSSLLYWVSNARIWIVLKWSVWIPPPLFWRWFS